MCTIFILYLGALIDCLIVVDSLSIVVPNVCWGRVVFIASFGIQYLLSDRLVKER